MVTPQIKQEYEQTTIEIVEAEENMDACKTGNNPEERELVKRKLDALNALLKHVNDILEMDLPSKGNSSWNILKEASPGPSGVSLYSVFVLFCSCFWLNVLT